MLRLRRTLLIAGLVFLTSGASAAPRPRAKDVGVAPFARVYLALRGCTSCSHCRTAIRQMARSGSDGGEPRVTTDAVEVRYPRPVASIPLRDVIRRLAENRLHDLTLVDVLFEAEGTVARSPSGATFTLRGSGQSFPLRLEPSQGASPDAPVRLTALVEGWRENGKLTLVARGIAPARST